MAISTYAELQTAVQNWLHRSDSSLTSRVTEFITLGEARIGREVRCRIQETRVTASADDYMSLPSDFLEMRNVFLTTGGNRYKLQAVGADSLIEIFTSTSTGTPTHYAVIGDELALGPAPSGTFTVEMWYYKKLTALSSATNTLFTNNPDLYLYASLAAAGPWLRDQKQVALWEGLYVATRNQVNGNEEKGRYGPGLRMVAA
jgi:hypothetical protein